MFPGPAAMRAGLTRSARSSCRPPPLDRRRTRCPVGGTFWTVKHRDSSCQWTVMPRPAPCQCLPTQRGQHRETVGRAAVRGELTRAPAPPRARPDRGRRCAGPPHAADRGPGEGTVSRPGRGPGTDGGSAATLPRGDRRWECDRSRHDPLSARRSASPPSSGYLCCTLAARDRCRRPAPRHRSLILQQRTRIVDTSTTLVDSSTVPSRRATRPRSTAAPCPTPRPDTTPPPPPIVVAATGDMSCPLIDPVTPTKCHAAAVSDAILREPDLAAALRPRRPAVRGRQPRGLHARPTS